MQKWGKRPIYFKNAEIMQNALIMQTLRPLTRVKRSKQQPRHQDERLCLQCSLPGHFKRNCPEIPYCSKCRTRHTQDDEQPENQRAGEPKDQHKRKTISHSFQAVTVSAACRRSSDCEMYTTTTDLIH